MRETGTESCDAGLTTSVGELGHEFSARYLAAKKVIDDRALNRHVWHTLLQALPESTAGEATRILELGAGIGTMVERLVEWGVSKGAGLYLATDQAIDHIRTARQRLAHFATARGEELRWDREGRGVLRSAEGEMTLVLAGVSVEELAQGLWPTPPCHLLIAHALLDLLDFTAILPHLFPRLMDKGLLLLTCNFDGETRFLPDYPGSEELEIIRRYHASMEARVSGASQCGRRLLSFLQAQGLTILAAGASDWRIHPQQGGYGEEEHFFLHTMVDTVERELSSQAPPPGLAAWARSRRRQIEAGELTFRARHLDILARLGGP